LHQASARPDAAADEVSNRDTRFKLSVTSEKKSIVVDRLREPKDLRARRPQVLNAPTATYSMSFCFLISDVVSAAIASTSRGTLAGL
jgi:hypothetical protein